MAGSQRRADGLGQINIIEANHRNVVRNSETMGVQRVQRANGGFIVARD
jgi:hypothetical protein